MGFFRGLQRYGLQQIIGLVGRDRLDYLCSNTSNVLTRRLWPFLWTYEQQALVLRRRMETADVTSFELLPNTYWQPAQAGQYVEIQYTVAGERLERAYSISAQTKDSFWITVKRHHRGRVSNALHEQLQPGDRLSLRGPFGEFVYQEQSALLLICAGAGITPCFALLESLLARPAAQRPDIQVYAQFSRPEDTIFAARLHALQALALPGFKLDLAYSRQPGAGSCPPLKHTALETVFADLRQRHVYLCGPPGFQAATRQALLQAGLPEAQLYQEHFQLLRFAPLAAAEASGPLPEVYFAPHHCRIQLRPEDRHKSLLELGLAQGLNLEKGCRKGYCGSCKLVLHQGEVRGQTQGRAVYICNAYADSERVVLGY